jgi:hemolysin activation/secretion protein
MINKICFFVALFCVPLVSADIPIGNNRDLSRFLQDHAKEHEKQIDENLKIPFEPYDNDRSAPLDGGDKNRTQACVPISIIIVEGVSKLSEKEIEKTTAPFKNRCLTAAMIENLLRQITALYHAKGFITSRAALKMPQEFTRDGILEIVVTEGWIEKIIFNEQMTNDRIQSRMALGHLVDEKLNIRDIDNAVEQINRLSSQNATMQIEPGSSVGASVIAVRTRPKDRVHISLNYHDEGKDLNDRATLTPVLLLENPFALNDQLRISHSRKDNDGSRRYERSNAASYTFPYAFWLFDLSFSESEYLSTITGGAATFKSSGFVETESLNANRLLFRDQRQKTSLNLGVERRKNKSFINETLIEVASHKVSNAKLGFSYFRYIDSGFVSFDINAKRGVGWFGADDEKEHIENNEPHKRFKLYNMRSYITKELSFFRLSADIYVQYSKDELLSSEQFVTVKDMSEDGGRSIALKVGFSPSKLLEYDFLEPVFIDLGYSAAKVESASSDGMDDFASAFSASVQINRHNYMCRAEVEFGGVYPSENGYKRKDYPYQKISCMLNFRFM